MTARTIAAAAISSAILCAILSGCSATHKPDSVSWEPSDIPAPPSPAAVDESAPEPPSAPEPTDVDTPQQAPEPYAAPESFAGQAYADEWAEYEPDGSFKSQGVVYDNGTRFTWYSSNASRHYLTDEWTAGDDGFYRDSDGYLVVASDDHAQGETVDTPWGEGRVYDSGCDSGTVDMYVNY